jgi:UTP--glucose-1-phosphate uridylyltransferase
VNRKTVDPGDSSSPEVIQLETAMGAAVGVFEGAAAIRVPRERFTPVKTTNDLLVLRSDAYELEDSGELRLAAPDVPFVDLDSGYFKLLRDLEERFAHGPPSLVGARRLAVRGDVAFGRDVTVLGAVCVENDGGGQKWIEDGTVLEG